MPFLEIGFKNIKTCRIYFLRQQFQLKSNDNKVFELNRKKKGKMQLK